MVFKAFLRFLRPDGHETGPAEADWWSLGCVLYEMLTTEAPYGRCDDILLEGQAMLGRQAAPLAWATEPPAAAKDAVEARDRLLGPRA